MNRHKLESLITSKIVSDIKIYDEVSSTNDIAKEYSRNKQGDIPALFISEIQTAGRGRRGRVWDSPPNTGIWMSYLFKSNLKPELIPAVTLLSAYSIAKAINTYTIMHSIHNLDIKIKWPNDIVINSKKICGILTELVSSTGPENENYIISGIGINVNTDHFSPEISDVATSLLIESGSKWSREELICYILTNISSCIIEYEKCENLEFLLDEYNNMLINKDREVILSSANTSLPEGRYLCHGIDKTGALIVEDKNKNLIPITSGEVSVRGIYGYV